MKLIKRVTLLGLALALGLGLTACDAVGGLGKPDMPMELTIDGHAIVLGQTNIPDLEGFGWEASFTGTQNEIREDAKYVACYYTINRPDGGTFWVTVWVPFQKNMVGSNKVDFSEEEKMSKTEGAVCRVNVRKDASEEFEILYNGINYQDMTWDTAKEWGAEETDRSNEFSPIFEIAASQGTVKFEKGYTGEDEPGEFTVSMNSNAFSKLQK